MVYCFKTITAGRRVARPFEGADGAEKEQAAFACRFAAARRQDFRSVKMSYRFCLGASGAGKSTYLHREAVRRAAAALERFDFGSSVLLIVPDQFTMQTQKDLVLAAGEYAGEGKSSHAAGTAPAAGDAPSDTAGPQPADRGGIMNIDVLSFGRLSHRIFEEIGADPGGILDDMGKSLILRRLAASCAKDLKVLGQKAGRPGMIAEVKSVISEFMQYGISADGVGELASYAASHGQGALAAKLSDLQVLYRAFLDERGSRFLTGEESLELLAEAVPKSRLVAGSIVILDGFTGFTPVQYRAILALMQCAKEVIVALDYAEDGGTPIADVMAGAPFEEQDLFFLTRQTVSQICRMGERGGVAHGGDIYIAGGKPGPVPQESHGRGKTGRVPSQDIAGCDRGGVAHGGDIYIEGGREVPPRFAGNPALAHLERSLFRSPLRVYEEAGTGSVAGVCAASGFDSGTSGAGDGAAGSAPCAGGADGKPARELPVHLILASNPGQEVRQMFIRIRRLTAQKGYHYRDIAVVAGDLSTYEDEIRVYAERYDVPIYIDTRRAVTQNPLTETIRSALEIGGGDYSYETVFRFLRGGLSGLSPDDVDRLDNYCLKRGIASRRRWETAFDPEYEPMRQTFLAAIRPLQAPRKGEAARAGGRNGSSVGGAAGMSASSSSGSGPAVAASSSSPGSEKPSSAGIPGRRQNAQERTRALYAFLLGIRAGEQMQEKARRLREQGQNARAMEYEQIYGEVIHLLDELYDLPGQEPISAKDYLDLVVTGFQEIRIGTLPQQADRIPVGDMERTRIPEVKILFFLGVNDGNIPKGTSKGGLLSDLDREFLQESGVLARTGASLSPTPREQMYIQRLYLYMNMTKPSKELYVSRAAVDSDGRSIRPSYFIGMMQQMYPQLETEVPEEAPAPEQMIAPKDASPFLAAALRDYADGLYLKDPARRDEVLTIYGFCAQQEAREMAPPAVHASGTGQTSGCDADAQAFARATDGPEAGAGGEERYCAGPGAGELRTGGCSAHLLRKAAFLRYRAVPLSKKTARQIYGRSIRGSVTRLESAANCYLQQFLRYGLHLEERERYTFEANDSGNIMHESIQRFGQLLQQAGISWTAFTKEQGRALIAGALRDVAGTYNDQVLFDSARSTYQAGRLQRILERTADTLQYQLLQGDFEPRELEQDFGGGGELSFALKGGGRLTLQGRIDRVDLAEGGADAGTRALPDRADPAGDAFRDNNAAPAKLYVKIVDYKSGKKDLDPVQIKAGLQLQLMVYMMAETDRLRGQHPGTEIVPAGMLYYRFDDPLLDGKDAARVLSEEDLSGTGASAAEEEIVRRKLRPKGMVGAEDDILGHLDRALNEAGSDSLAVPAKRLKGGGLSKTSRVYTADEYAQMSRELKETLCRLAEDILDGRTDAAPVRTDANHSACTWCPYKDACGFDPRIPGYEYRDLKDLA